MVKRLRHTDACRWSSERASVTVVVAGALVLLSLLSLGVVRVGLAATARARAQAAADAVALAGVVDGRDAAEQMAAVNGAAITLYSDEGTELEVEVRVDDAVATARAFRKDPPPTVVVLDPPPDSTVADTTAPGNTMIPGKTGAGP